MKVGDLVQYINAYEATRGIVLEFYSTAEWTRVYWLSHKEYRSHPADDLEVISEGR